MIAVTETYLRKRSSEILHDKSKDSQIISRPKKIPALLPTEIKTGPILGCGTFCIVAALEGIKHTVPTHLNEEKTNNSDENSLSFYRDLETRSGKKSYAIKKLIPGLYKKQSHGTFAQGVIDLAMEAKYLSVLQHPHIINIRAIADIDDSSKDFFIVIDRLVMTLEHQINNWKNRLIGWQSFRGQRKNNKKELFCEQLMVAHDICSALAYLHSKNIVYRDLKPKNIGFDEKGDVKLFDFGTATEMTEKRRHNNTDTFKLTKKTGTPKYMAPEVYLGHPYNEKCDVYSFALLLWHCLEGKRPFEHYDEVMMEARVFLGKEVPNFNREWSRTLKLLFANCLRRDFDNRHSASDVMTSLNIEIGKLM